MLCCIAAVSLAQLPSPEQFAAKFASSTSITLSVPAGYASCKLNTKFANANASKASILLHHSSLLVCHNDCDAQPHHMQHVYACM